MTGRKSYGQIWSAAVFLILEIAAILMLTGTGTLQDIWISRASHRTHALLWGTGERIRNYFTLDEQNRALADKNMELMKAVQTLGQQALSFKNGHLYDSATVKFRMIPATIVKVSRNSQHNYIVLNKGSEDGVKPQTGIVTTNGVVGMVNTVGKHYSYGITLMNTRMSVSARIGPTGMVAPLEWDGKSTDGAVMRGLPLHHEIAPGDTVWTSGFSSVFPSDIPIGITQKSKLVDGSTVEVAVRLFQDFSALRYVIITENLDRDSIAEIEKEALK